MSNAKLVILLTVLLLLYLIILLNFDYHSVISDFSKTISTSNQSVYHHSRTTTSTSITIFRTTTTSISTTIFREREHTSSSYQTTTEQQQQPQCLVTQSGIDGFGHQVFGKLSCLLLATLNPKEAFYIHTPFTNFQHLQQLDNNKIVDLENFINIQSSSVSYQDFVSDHGEEVQVKILPPEKNWLPDGVVDYCLPNTLYVVDNCFSVLFYTHSLVQELNKISTINFLRGFYFRTQKPTTGFKSSEINIAMHVRGGDAGDRIRPLYYYQRGLEIYIGIFESSLKPMTVWVLHNDYRGLEYTNKLRVLFPQISFIAPSSNAFVDSIILDFHRMVEANGVISSISSLSWAAIMFNVNSPIIVSSVDTQSRELWFNTNRFIRVGDFP